MFFLDIPIKYNDAIVNMYLQDGFFETNIQTASFHRHAYIECHYIYKGALEFNINGKTISVPEGTALLIGPNIFHSFSLIHPDSKRVVFQLNCDKLGSKRFTEDYLLKRKSFSLIDNLEREIALIKSTNQYHMLTEYMKLLFYELICDTNETSNNSVALPIDRKLQIYELVNNSLNVQPTLEYVAKEIHISPRQLNRIMLELFQMNFTEYLTSMRLEHAKHLLEQTDIPLKEISQQVGFSSYSGFWRAFKKKFGVSPNRHDSDMNDESSVSK